MNSQIDHYTALLTVHAVSLKPNKTDYSSKPVEQFKDTEEIAKVVIRDATLEGLRDKINKHSALI